MIKTQSAIDLDLTPEERRLVLEFFPQGLIAIDLETTGLSPLVDRIIEVGAMKIGPQSTDVFQSLINPEIEIPPHTTDIHHITDDMVKNSPKSELVLKGLLEFIGELPIVAHNAKFDLGFIVMGFQKWNLPVGSNDIYCSCKLARHTHMELKNHKLSTLVMELNIPLLNHHRAFDDAYASLKVFVDCLKRAKTPQSPIVKRYGHLFNLNQFEKFEILDLPEHLAALEKLVKEAAVIEMKYSGGNYKNEFRPVKLSSLMNTPDGNILSARCLWSDLQKSFKLNKVQEIRTPSAEDIQKWLKKV